MIIKQSNSWMRHCTMMSQRTAYRLSSIRCNMYFLYNELQYTPILRAARQRQRENTRQIMNNRALFKYQNGLSRYGDFHDKDRMTMRPAYPYPGDLYSGKKASLYRDARPDIHPIPRIQITQRLSMNMSVPFQERLRDIESWQFIEPR